MKIVTFATSKGGVGKTTLSVGVAADMARRGLKVLLCDFDPQGSATIALGLNTSASRSVTAWMENGGSGSMEDFVVEAYPNLDVLRGHETVIVARSNYEQALRESDSPASMMQAVGELMRIDAHRYDIVILDTPADNILREACVLAADLVVSPVPPARADIEGFNLFVGQINSLAKMVGRTIPVFVIVNRHDMRHKRSRKNLFAMYDGIREIGDQFQIAGVIHNSAAISDSFGEMPVPLCNENRRNRRAKSEFSSVTEKILGGV